MKTFYMALTIQQYLSTNGYQEMTPILKNCIFSTSSQLPFSIAIILSGSTTWQLHQIYFFTIAIISCSRTLRLRYLDSYFISPPSRVRQSGLFCRLNQSPFVDVSLQDLFISTHVLRRLKLIFLSTEWINQLEALNT